MVERLAETVTGLIWKASSGCEWKNDKSHRIFWYGEYEQVPFDAKLFAKPEIVEAKP